MIHKIIRLSFGFIFTTFSCEFRKKCFNGAKQTIRPISYTIDLELLFSTSMVMFHVPWHKLGTLFIYLSKSFFLADYLSTCSCFYAFPELTGFVSNSHRYRLIDMKVENLVNKNTVNFETYLQG